MKTITSILFSLLLSLSFNTKAAEFEPLNNLGDLELMSPCTLRIRICYVITGRIGKGSPCTDFSFSCLKSTNCNKSNDFDLKNVTGDNCKLIFCLLEPNVLNVSFLATKASSDYWVIDNDYALPATICKDLGIAQAKITPGKYKCTQDPSGSWSVNFNIKH